MKTKTSKLYQFITCVILLCFFVSCKKDTTEKLSGPEEFIEYTIDAVSYFYNVPSDTLKQINLSLESAPFNSYIKIGCRGQDGNYTALSFSKFNIGVNRQQPLTYFGTTAVLGINNALIGTSNVSITEYGAVGEYIAGNFTSLLIESQNQSISHNLICRFRVRRIH